MVAAESFPQLGFAETDAATTSQRHEVHARTLVHQLFELSGIVGFFALVILLLARSGAAVVETPCLALPAVAALLIGYVVADFMSGLVHFTFDRFFTTSTPVLGTAFVSAFRQHHSDPVDITHHGFIAGFSHAADGGEADGGLARLADLDDSRAACDGGQAGAVNARQAPGAHGRRRADAPLAGDDEGLGVGEG